MNDDRKKLIEECKRIEEDSLYTAETHFLIAQKLTRKNMIIKYIPTVVSFVSQAVLVYAIISKRDIIFQLLSLLISVGSTAVSFFNLLNDTDKKIKEHESAGKMFTALKHEARSLYQTFEPFLDEQAFLREVYALRKRYNLLVKSTPITDNKSYEEARCKIRSENY
jgi:hypothetical protein